ncbi:MAG: phosphatase PAP2 family protein [Bacteroidota bacterium]
MQQAKIFTLFLFTILLFIAPLRAQDFPYTFDLGRELSLLGLGGGLSITGHTIEAQMEGLNQESLSARSSRDIFFLDRGATRQRSEQYRKLSDRLLQGSLLLPASLMATKPARSKPLLIGLMAVETGLLTEGSTKLLKVIFRRRRPLTYNPDFPLGEQLDNNALQSFPSGHTSNTAALSFFTAKVFHDLHPESPLRPYVWVAAGVIPALTGYARFRAGKHFPSDILVGYALGAAMGIMVPEWHKEGNAKKLRVLPTEDGIGLVYRW